MSKGYDIQQELESISSYIAALPRTMPYSVPGGYFDQFESSVKEHLTQPCGKTLPYTVPHGYFETLTENITTQLAENTGTSSRNMPYAAPHGYFESLPEQILRAATLHGNESNKARIIPLKTHNFFKPLRWAAAAIVLLGIGIGSYFTLYNAQQETGADKILASISNSEIQEYIQGAYRVDVNRIVSNDNDINEITLDNNDIISYLDETGWD